MCERERGKVCKRVQREYEEITPPIQQEECLWQRGCRDTLFWAERWDDEGWTEQEIREASGWWADLLGISHTRCFDTAELFTRRSQERKGDEKRTKTQERDQEKPRFIRWQTYWHHGPPGTLKKKKKRGFLVLPEQEVVGTLVLSTDTSYSTFSEKVRMC